MASSSNDLLLIFIILFTFVIMHMALTLSIGHKKISDNWDDYKCNPGIIPLAGLWPEKNATPSTLLNDCIQNQQAGFMEVCLEPLYGSLNNIASMGATFTKVFENIKISNYEQTRNVTNFADVIEERFNIVATEFNKLFINTTDTLYKSGSMISTIFYLVESTIQLSAAIWNGLPGQLVRTSADFIGKVPVPP